LLVRWNGFVLVGPLQALAWVDVPVTDQLRTSRMKQMSFSNVRSTRTAGAPDESISAVTQTPKTQQGADMKRKIKSDHREDCMVIPRPRNQQFTTKKRRFTEAEDDDCMVVPPPKKQLASKECIVCCNDLAPSKFPTLRRTHKHEQGVCSDCWEKHLSSAIEVQGWDALQCLECELKLNEPMIRRLASETTYGG